MRSHDVSVAPITIRADAPTASAELRFQPDAAPRWLVTVELPSSWSMLVEPRTVELTLRNSTGSVISLGELVASCGCIHGRRIETAVAVSNGEEFSIEIVPTWAWAGGYHQSLWLPISGEPFGDGVVRVDVVGQLPEGPAEELFVPATVWLVDGHVRLDMLANTRTQTPPSPVSIAWITEAGPVVVEPVEFAGWQRLGGDEFDPEAEQLWRASMVLPASAVGDGAMLAVTNRGSTSPLPFHALNARQVRVRSADAPTASVRRTD